MKTFEYPDDHKMYVVTVKKPKRPWHDPMNKITSACCVSETCTDATGAHHSYLTTGRSIQDVEEVSRKVWGHVTRIEEVMGREE